MALNVSFTNRGRILRYTFLEDDGYGEATYTEIAGSEFNLHKEPVSDDELFERYGEVNREITKVYMDSLPAGITAADKLQIQNQIPVDSDGYPWTVPSLADNVHEIVSIEDGGGRHTNLQMFVRLIRAQ